jgi:predicted RNase H-like HicB family nuclease
MSVHDPKDYEISIRYSPEDECYVARVVEWHGIAAHGATLEEAAREIQVALSLALDYAGETGTTVPAPAVHHAAA